MIISHKIKVTTSNKLKHRLNQACLSLLAKLKPTPENLSFRVINGDPVRLSKPDLENILTISLVKNSQDQSFLGINVLSSIKSDGDIITIQFNKEFITYVLDRPEKFGYQAVNPFLFSTFNSRELALFLFFNKWEGKKSFMLDTLYEIGVSESEKAHFGLFKQNLGRSLESMALKSGLIVKIRPTRPEDKKRVLLGDGNKAHSKTVRICFEISKPKKEKKEKNRKFKTTKPRKMDTWEFFLRKENLDFLLTPIKKDQDFNTWYSDIQKIYNRVARQRISLETAQEIFQKWQKMKN